MGPVTSIRGPFTEYSWEFVNRNKWLPAAFNSPPNRSPVRNESTAKFAVKVKDRAEFGM